MFCRTDPAKKRSKQIQEELEDDAKVRSEYTQLLLLGTGESGKTTIIKQTKILHINGFTESERKEKIPFIRQNIHESIYTIIHNMDKLYPPISLENAKNINAAECILSLGPEEPYDYTDEYFDYVKSLWADGGVQKCYKRSSEYQLLDSTEQFMNRIDAIRRLDYIPSTEDILFCRVTTTSISKIEFKVPISKKNGGGTAKFWMFDVGGQRGHRKKWISVFEGIDSVLFLIAASDFDQKLREDESKNRLKESFEVFENVFWGSFLRGAGMIVFLNKQDILQKKIESGKRIEDHFPEYKNYKPTKKEGIPSSEYEKSKFFMRQKLLDISVNKPEPELEMTPTLKVIEKEVDDRDVYIHFTVATDTKNIKLVFDSVYDMILNINLGQILL